MRVTLFGDLPEEHWPSMARYGQTLAGELRSQQGLDLRVYPEPALGVAPRRRLVLVRRALVHPWQCRFRQGQVNHVLDHSYGHLLYFIDPRRSVVTCHDLAPLAYPDGVRRFSPSMLTWRWAFRGTLRAARIIADSASTKDDVVRFGGYPMDRIDVVPLGVLPAFFAPPRPEDRTLRPSMAPPGSPLILHVGNCEPRKNIEGLLQALERVRSSPGEPQACLWQIGGCFTEDQRALIRRLRLDERVQQTSHVPEEVLPGCYRAADLVALPSWYEGFGFPVLEAMAAGTPVVCSDRTSLPEVAGEAALVVDPANPEALAGAMERGLADATLRRELVERGRERAARFTWAACAARTREVYEKVAGSPPYGGLIDRATASSNVGWWRTPFGGR